MFELEIYLDKATIPSIQQAAVIVERSSRVKKLISWRRYACGDEVLDSLNAEYYKKIKDLYVRAAEVLKKHSQSEVTIFGNISWARDVLRCVKKIQGLKGVKIKSIELYDDGVAEYVNLLERSKDGNPLTGGDQISQYLNPLKGLLLRKKLESKMNFSIDASFGLSEKFQVNYNMLLPEVASNLLNQLGFSKNSSINKIKWDYFINFSKDQKNAYYELLGITVNLQNMDDAFLFLGSDESFISKQSQVSLLKNCTNKDSLFHVQSENLFFKGHPEDKEDISQYLPSVKVLDQRIPIEVFMMSGNIPRNIGGIASTAFITASNICDIAFIVFPYKRSEMSSNSLIELFSSLDIVPKEKIFFLDDIATGIHSI